MLFSKLSYRANVFKYPFLLSLALIISLTLATSANSQNYQGNNLNVTQSIGGGSSSPIFKIPLLILMSGDDVSVAQLPMIDNGTISVVYRMQDVASSATGDAEREGENWGSEEVAAGSSTADAEDGHESSSQENSEIENRSSSSSSSESNLHRSNADAREYEQMPRTTSLGKSEWPKREQIAGSSQFGSSGDRGSQEEVGTTKTHITVTDAAERRGEAEEEHEEEKNKKRPRRRETSGWRKRRSSSNSLADDYGKSSNSDGKNESNNSPTNAVMESSSAASNVTSAQFSVSGSGSGNSGASSNRANRVEEEDEASSLLAAASTPEGGAGDKNSGISAQFSDFDVHMTLGYAFVADSSGRIHRFKLSVGDDYKGNANSNDDDRESLLENGNEDDYTNTIDAASYNDFSQRKAPNQQLNRDRLVPANVTVNGNNDDKSGSDRNKHGYSDANIKVSSGDVTLEQSGRHPTSGVGKLVLNSRLVPVGLTKLGDTESAVAATTTPISDKESALEASSNNDNNLESYGKETNNQPQSRLASLALKPRIIWSRTKHGLGYTIKKPTATATSPAVKSAMRQSDEKRGALPGAASQHSELSSSSVEGESSQMANGGSQSTGNDADEGSQAPVAHENGQKTQPLKLAANSKKLRTEIAVDWMNNLLFVLDKYRLLVTDFDGNNELVLIDDFNVNNRPIDIKVDPVNDFLFWLQVGKFYNTIYKLDLNVLSMPAATERLLANTLKLSAEQIKQVGQHNRHIIKGPAGFSSSELVALISHHYAHPIITNLPKHTRLFTIDHKHSRIYVPLTPPVANQLSAADQSNKTQREDAEVFATTNNSLGPTHLNSTTSGNQVGSDCNDVPSAEYTQLGLTTNQILAYNLDGTDVGPLRNDNEKSHLSDLDDMQDMTMDSRRGYLYWLTNDGKELVEEYKADNDNAFYSAQHSLDGKKYMKLIHFNPLNQPTNVKPRFNLRKLIHMLSSATNSPDSTNRWTRSDMQDKFEDNKLASSLNGRRSAVFDSDASRFSRNAPFIVLGIVCLLVLTIYLIYAFVFQRLSIGSARGNGSVSGSMAGSSIDESHVDCGATTSGFMGPNTISRWMAIHKPSTSTQLTDNNSTVNRDSSIGNHDRLDSYDLGSSTNYHAENEIDKHCREFERSKELFSDLNTDHLVNLREWPTSMLDMSNKLYVPVELSSIHRIPIDQLEIDRCPPLGEGNFGLVLQGTIRCSVNEKFNMLNKSQEASTCMTDPTSYCSSLRVIQHRREPIASSTSSGHGSSSVSSEFITATSGPDATTGDYLTPKSHCTSNMSDYMIGSSRPDSCDSNYQNQTNSNQDDIKACSPTIVTKFRVAIKKLKDNASVEVKSDFLQEAKILSNFEHPNIVQLYGICLDRGSTFMVMELMLGGDLNRYMQDNDPLKINQDQLTYDDLLTICLDIANGCCHVEELKYIHRDLAARNCLVSSRKRDERVVKLADFGLARDIHKDSYYRKLNDSAMPLKWMAPECFNDQKFSIKSDVWSFGIVMWEVLSYCREKPYGSVAPLLMREYLISGARLKKPDHCTEEVYKLMNGCWQLEPEKRPTFHDCRNVLIEIKNKYSQKL